MSLIAPYMIGIVRWVFAHSILSALVSKRMTYYCTIFLCFSRNFAKVGSNLSRSADFPCSEESCHLVQAKIRT
jgi:hypothetical protein